MKKRIVSLLLVVMMLFSLTGQYAFSAKAPSQDDSQILSNEKTTEDVGCEHEYADGICSLCGAPAENVKFYFGVTSGSTVDAVVYDDYSALVRLPVGGKVSTEGVSVKAIMQNVRSLGVAGIRSHSIDLNTGAALGSHEVDLEEWLENAYYFDGGKINAVIDGKEVTYTFAGIDENGRIQATTDTEAARAAWQALTSYVSTSAQPTDDSRIVVANGSYIKLGTEYLRFEKEEGDLTLDGLNDMSKLSESIRNALYLDTCEDMGSVIEIFVAKGTQLAVGQSVAELKNDCLITVDFGSAKEVAVLKGQLTALRDANDVYTLVQKLVGLFNDVVGLVDSVREVNVDITFEEAQHSHVFDRMNTDAAYLAGEASCTAKATYYYSCTCGEKGTDTFESGDTLPHSFILKNSSAKYLASEATCSSPATYYYSCVYCKTAGTNTFESGKALPHSFTQQSPEEKYLASPATCTSAATYYVSCAECGEKGTDTFEYGDKLPHVFDRTNTDAAYLAGEASCTAKATYYYSCACGEKGTDTFEYGDKLPHVFDQTNTDAAYLAGEASCTAKATYYYSCTCGEKGTDTFEYGDILPHVFDQTNTDAAYLASEASCTAKATYYYSCTCGEKGTDTFEYGDKLPHVFDQKNTDAEFVMSEGDCRHKTVYYYSCTCGEKGTDTFEGDYGTHKYADGFCSQCGDMSQSMKFYFAVSSGSTVDMRVFDDYNAVFCLPIGGKVSTEGVNVKAIMQNVRSLGVVGIRSHSIDLNTGAALGSHEVDLEEWLENAYYFDGGKINAVIDGKEVTYIFAGIDENGRIEATTDTEAARAAWQALTSYVSTSAQPTDDSRIVVANGSYIKLGTEYLRFEKEEGDLLIDDLNDMSALNASIRNALYLDTCEDMGSVIEIFIAKGTQLAVGQSVAELKNDCLITVDFGNAKEVSALKGQLTALRDAKDVYTLVQKLVGLFNDVVGVVDSVSEVNVNVAFATQIPGDVDCDGDVDSDDAVYLLWYTFMPEEYPIKQSCDFNMDGKVDSDDAVYLLWNTFMPENYPLYGNK